MPAESQCAEGFDVVRAGSAWVLQYQDGRTWVGFNTRQCAVSISHQIELSWREMREHGEL